MDKPSTVSISEGGRPAWVTKGAPPVVGLRLLHSDLVFEFGNLERLAIGTDARCDIALDDPTVSSSHAVLERERDTVMLQDTNSRNGTYINGTLCQRAELRDGAIITLGRTHLVAFSNGSRTRKIARERIAGHSPAVLRGLDEAERAALDGRNVLIVGEPGTGKSLMAQVIHEIARGPALPFVVVDCNAAEAAAQLFGSGPTALDAAEGGTLFIKEPAELSERNVARLFEALRERSALAPASLRLVASTSHVSAPIRSYETIAPVTITLPPLRERMTDLQDLVARFLDELLGKQRRELSRQTMTALKRYDWPGNVAELKDAIRRIVALATSRSKRKAAESIPMPHATFDRWIERMGLPSTRQGDCLW